MDPNRFETPVTVFTGLGFRTSVESVAQAYALLLDWPRYGRDPAAHAVALKVCKAALAGEIEAETARGAFVTFARRAHILAPDVDDVVAASQLKSAQSSHAM